MADSAAACVPVAAPDSPSTSPTVATAGTPTTSVPGSPTGSTGALGDGAQAPLPTDSNADTPSTAVRADRADGAEPDDEAVRLQQALTRIAQLEDQNVALWQELHNEGSGDGSSDVDSPHASRDAASGSGAKAVTGSGGGLTKRISGRFTQEAFAEKEEELTFLRQRCMQFEVEVEQEFEELNAQLFNAQQKVHELQQSNTESEAKSDLPSRRQMEAAKLMVEAKLQETGQQLMECERQLVAAGSRREKKISTDGASASMDGASGAVAESPGTPPSSSRTGHPFFNSLLENEVEQLKEENEAMMGELVLKKMALAELSESFSKVKRDLHRREAKDRAFSSKMSRMHAILGGAPPRAIANGRAP